MLAKKKKISIETYYLNKGIPKTVLLLFFCDVFGMKEKKEKYCLSLILGIFWIENYYLSELVILTLIPIYIFIY